MSPTLIYDWNGTLLDDAEILLKIANSMLNRFGRPPIDILKLRDQCDMPFKNLYRSFGLSHDEIEILYSDGNAAFHELYEPLATQAVLRTGAKEILELARQQNVRTLILSNHLVEPIKLQLRRLGVEGTVTEVLAYENRNTQYVDMSKGERLRRYMLANNISPETAVIVGDMPEERDIASSLGLISVSITGGFVSEPRLRAEEPDYIIHDHHELSPILYERGIFQKSLSN